MLLINGLFLLALILVSGVVYLVLESFHRSEAELLLRLSHIQRQLAASAHAAQFQASITNDPHPSCQQLPNLESPSSCEQSGFFNVGSIQGPDTRCA